MGNKNQTTASSSKSVRNHQQYNQYQAYNDQKPPLSHQQRLMYQKQLEQQQHHHQYHNQQQKENYNKKNSVKRHLSSSNRNLVNRSSSSPQIANKWRLSQLDSNQDANHAPEIYNLTRSPLTSRVNKPSRLCQEEQEQEEQQKREQHELEAATNDVSTNNRSIVDVNREMKAKQESLTNVIKTIDSTSSQQASYQTGGSKLYRPNSFLTSNTTTTTTNNNSNNSSNTTSNTTNSRPRSNNNVQSQPPQQNLHQKGFKNTIDHTNNNYINKSSTLPISHTAHDLTCYSNDDNYRNAQTLNKNAGLSKSNGKLNKRFGLSPKFKRKIVETITNRNSIFSQSRLLQALQSQWNLFASPSQRISQKKGGHHYNNSEYNDYDHGDESRDFEDYDDEHDEGGGGDGGENDDEENPFEHRRHHHHHHRSNRDGAEGSTCTFLSTSLMRNSFRYASRRKYKTQSLANPYRHANTNYPVYIHEALFMPEFSVKGQVTEADFEILDVISRGAFGHVIKVKKKQSATGEDQNDAVDQTSEQVYAMKIMWKSQVIRDRALQQVKDEVTIATSCVENPLIVKTWFYWQSKRFLYIITDFVENGELLSLWLKVHHFPERLVAVYAIEMCLVLDYLHRNGIIYRDIKMENILLDKRGHVQLIDFGLSKWLPMGERTCTICGTIQYMAPEILSVEPYDHSVDWWSLGILMYALLSGEYPLSAAKDHIQMNEKVSRHIFELSQTQGNYSTESSDLVRKLLRKNPQRRLKSLNECKQDQFFQKEIASFTRLHGQSPEQELFIAENFWNPYFIIQNYAPLQLLFDEIYASRNKAVSMNEGLKKPTKHHRTAPTTVEQAPPPPPPPPQQQQQQQPAVVQKTPLQKESNSSSSTSAASSSSCSATRTTTSLPNSSASDDVVVVADRDNDIVCYEDKRRHHRHHPNRPHHHHHRNNHPKFDDADDEDDDDDDVDEIGDEYDEEEDDVVESTDEYHRENDELTGFTKF